jgi:hypothetical protein
MATATCETDVDLAVIANDKVLQLYHQNPKLGFYLIRLVIQRLLENYVNLRDAADAARVAVTPGLAGDGRTSSEGPRHRERDRYDNEHHRDTHQSWHRSVERPAFVRQPFSKSSMLANPRRCSRHRNAASAPVLNAFARSNSRLNVRHRICGPQ